MKKRRHRTIPTPTAGWESCTSKEKRSQRSTRGGDHLTASAEQGNQFAQYALGRLYLDGREVPRDPDQSWDWFSAMAEQGNKYAQFFLAHFNDTQSSYASGRHQAASPPGADIPGQLRAACRTRAGHGVDRKLLRKIRAKKIVMGHKPGDHEDLELTQGGMGGMTGY